MIRIYREQEINTEKWIELTKSSIHTSYFQTYDCYRFFKSLSFLEPFTFGLEENEDLKVVAVGYIVSDGSRIKRFFSRRAVILGGLSLDSDTSQETLEIFLETITKELKNKAIYLEIRNFTDYSDYKQTFTKCDFSYQPHLNFHVPTPDVDKAFQQLNTTKRRDVRISLKNGAVIEDTKKIVDVRDFYLILSDLYQNKVKTPLFPEEFFTKAITENPDAHLFCIKYNEKIIGGSFCFALDGRKLYELFVCGLDGVHKNIFPSTLATWAAIEYTAQHQFEYFDMMGAGKPDESYGVREFKSKFGGELVEYGRFQYIFNKTLFSLGKKAINYLKRKK